MNPLRLLAAAVRWVGERWAAADAHWAGQLNDPGWDD